MVTSSGHSAGSLLPLVKTFILLNLPPSWEPYITSPQIYGRVYSERGDRLVPLFLDSSQYARPIGIIRSEVLKALLEDNKKRVETGLDPSFEVIGDDREPLALILSSKTPQERTAVLSALLVQWRDSKRFNLEKASFSSKGEMMNILDPMTRNVVFSLPKNNHYRSFGCRGFGVNLNSKPSSSFRNIAFFNVLLLPSLCIESKK